MDKSSEVRIRTALFILAALMFAGTPVELWLADHTQEIWQLIPFVLCAIGLIAILAVLFYPKRSTLRLVQGAMFLNILGGLMGMAFHFFGNYSFQQEIRPNASFGELLMKTLKGADPLMAPGLLVFIALMVLIATYHHPAFGKAKTQ